MSKLEVSLTLTNKFEGLETDSSDASARSLLLRWVRAARSPGPARTREEAIPPSAWAPVLWAGPPEALPSPGLCCPPGPLLGAEPKAEGRSWGQGRFSRLGGEAPGVGVLPGETVGSSPSPVL